MLTTTTSQADCTRCLEPTPPAPSISGVEPVETSALDVLRTATHVLGHARDAVLVEFTPAPGSTTQVRALRELSRLTDATAALVDALTGACTIRLDGRPRH